MHVTLKVVEGLTSLRCTAAFLAVAEAVRRANAMGHVRIVQFSVQADHIHMICEADSNDAMARGMNGFSIRVARGLNRWLGRSGKVFADRYHRQDLGSPRLVRNAIRYVLQNVFKHLSHLRHIEGMDGLPAPDPFLSGPWFDGWKEGCRRKSFWPDIADPTALASSWLLHIGWHHHGPLSLSEHPA